MQYIVEENLSNFKFWSGGKDRADMLTTQQLDDIEEALERDYFADREELPTDTEINDLFWFDFEFICGLIGLMYKDDGNVWEHDEWAEHAEEVVKQYCAESGSHCYETYWSQFADGIEFDDINSDDAIKREFDEWVSDNWLDHAHEVLDEQLPYIPEEARDDYACEYWQNCNSDELNVKAFFFWWDKVQDKYKKD